MAITRARRLIFGRGVCRTGPPTGCRCPGGGSPETAHRLAQRFGAHGSSTVRSQYRFVGEPPNGEWALQTEGRWS